MLSGKHVSLNTGHQIPLIGFGTDKITEQSAMELAVKTALEVGYRHFDTAKVYGNEQVLGFALKKLMPEFNLNRSDIFLTTKVLPFNDKDKIKELVGESLVNLRTDCLDLVLIHYPKSNNFSNTDPENKRARERTWLTLEQLQKEGLVKSIGVSNYEVKHIEEMKSYSSTVPSVNQVEFHPHFRREPLKKYCRRNGIFFENPALLEDPTVLKVAHKYDTSVSTILLAFALCQRVGVVPKSVNPARIRQNVEAQDVKLDEYDLCALNSIQVEQHYMGRCQGWLVE